MLFVPVPPLLRPYRRPPISPLRRLPLATASENTNNVSDPNNKDDAAPIPSIDWRAYRARLVELERYKTDTATTSPSISTPSTSPSISTPSTSPSTSSSPQKKSRWVHEVGAVEQGCLLIASPAHFGARQQYFAQTVIFVLDHSKETGTVGVILNRPLTYSLAQVPISGDAEKSWASLLRMPSFAEAPLYLGGPMEQGRLVLLHGDEKIEGSTRIIEGVYAGGLPGALERVAKGELEGGGLRFFSGYSGWGKGQLQKEVNEGVWFVAAGSTDVVTEHCVKLERPLWRQVLDCMGGKYKDISKRLDELDGGKYTI